MVFSAAVGELAKGDDMSGTELATKPGGVPSVPLPPGAPGVLQSLMRLVVTQGSGVRANVPGAPVYGTCCITPS